MKNLFLFLLLLTLSCNALALKQEDLLHPDKAFQFSATPVDTGLVRLSWDIADGYYLYRKRFGFSSLTDNVSLDAEAAVFPKSKIKSDVNLGDMEVYYKQVSIEVPVKRGSENQAALEFELNTKYQGCADTGFCYPPQRKKTKITLAAQGETEEPLARDSNKVPAIQTTSEITQAVLVDKTATSDNETPPKTTSKNNEQANEQLIPLPGISNKTQALPTDQAFQFTLSAVDKSTLSSHWQITPEHQLYRTKINFRVLSPESIQLGTPVFPNGKIVDDEFFGEMEIYDDELNITIPLPETTAEQLTIETSYQGCSNSTGICYAPVTKENVISLIGLPEKIADQENTNQQQVNSAATDEFFSGSFLGTLVAFFVIGLGLSLTPCIFPMIPILSGIIAGQTHLSAYRAFILSLIYVLASASAYALIGLVFGFFGENLQSSLQHPAAIGLFAALFVTLAMSMFGFFDLQMPNIIQSRLNEISNNQRSGSLLGAAIMGFLSTLIVGPCVAPALAAALTYIANSKDAVLGASALFSMGFGMGIILLIVGTLGGHLLPRAGAWMDTTKAIFGIMLLGMAIWMLDRIVPIGITMFLSGVLLVASGIYMGALDKLQEEAGGWGRFWKSIGLILLFYGGTQLLGVSAGSQNILQPLKGIFTVAPQSTQGTVAPTSTQAKNEKPLFRYVKSTNDIKQLLSTTKQSKQLVLLDFYADWCVDCVRMDKNVFSDPAVKAALTDVILLKADVTQRSKQNKDMEKAFNIVGEPTILFFNKEGKEISNLRLVGYENSSKFLQRLKQFRKN